MNTFITQMVAEACARRLVRERLGDKADVSLQIATDIRNDALLMRVCHGSEFVTALLNSSDLRKSLDDFSAEVLMPVVRRLPAMQRAKVRSFKQKKLAARSVRRFVRT